MKKSIDSPTSIADILKTQLQGFVDKNFQNIQILTEKWPQIVGATIAQNTKILYLKKSCLYIGVSHSTWLCELNLLRHQLLHQLNEALPKFGIKEFKFKRI